MQRNNEQSNLTELQQKVHHYVETKLQQQLHHYVETKLQQQFPLCGKV